MSSLLLLLAASLYVAGSFVVGYWMLRREELKRGKQAILFFKSFIHKLK